MRVTDKRTGEGVVLHAQGSWVFVRIDDRPTHYPGSSMVTTDISFVTPTEGVVLSVGRDAPRDLWPGDRVRFGKFNGHHMEHLEADGGKVYCMRADYSKPLPYVPDIYAAVDP